MPNAKRDQNRITTLIASSSADGKTVVPIKETNSSLNIIDANSGSDFGNDAVRDQNRIPILYAVSATDGVTPIAIYGDSSTGSLLVTSGIPQTISFDQASIWHSAVSTSSLTYSHTVGAGTNTMLFVGCLSTNNDVTATYNGIAMTNTGFIVETTVDTRTMTLFCLPNPTAGTNNVVITGASTEAVLQSGSESWFGVKQTTTPDAVTTNFAIPPSSSFSTSVTSITDNSWGIILARATGGSVTIASGSNANLRANSGNTAIGDSNGPFTPAGTATMTCTVNGSTVGAGAFSVMAVFAPAS